MVFACRFKKKKLIRGRCNSNDSKKEWGSKQSLLILNNCCFDYVEIFSN